MSSVCAMKLPHALFGACLLTACTAMPLLRHGRGVAADAGDWGEDDTEVLVCSLPAVNGSDLIVKVFADEAENTRYVSFAREGYISDDSFVESMVKCQGSLPPSCLKRDASWDPTSCASTCPCNPDSSAPPYGNYQHYMLDWLEHRCNGVSSGSFRVLLVGLGGGALAQQALHHCKDNMKLTAVESDSRMIKVATQFFGLPQNSSHLVVKAGDGGDVVAALASEGQLFDVVLVDAFAGGPHVPETCRDATFVRNLQRVLAPNGTALHNIKVDYAATLPVYAKVFGSAVRGDELRGHNELPGHIIIAGSLHAS